MAGGNASGASSEVGAWEQGDTSGAGEGTGESQVEHPFLRLKRLFGYAKVRYRGLAKNAERLALLFRLGNLLTAEGQLSG